MTAILALAVFSLVASGTPGPNNTLLWASGVRFGFKATLGHVVGTAIGLGTMALATAAGIGVLVTTVPQVELALKVAGSIYLLFLAYQVSGIGALKQAEISRPLGVAQAIAFQYVNPKAWFFALVAIGTFRPPEFPLVVGSVLVAATMMAVIIPTAMAWAAGGTIVSGLISNDRTRRVVSILLAFTLVAMVALVWV